MLFFPAFDWAISATHPEREERLLYTRDVIVEESNAIGTLWLRAGLLDEPLREELRSALGDYTDTRIALGGSRGDLDALRAAQSAGAALHAKIWSVVERADHRPPLLVDDAEDRIAVCH